MNLNDAVPADCGTPCHNAGVSTQIRIPSAPLLSLLNSFSALIRKVRTPEKWWAVLELHVLAVTLQRSTCSLSHVNRCPTHTALKAHREWQALCQCVQRLHPEKRPPRQLTRGPITLALL